MRRALMGAGIGLLALAAVSGGTACGDAGTGASTTTQVSPTESLLDPGQTGPVDAPAD